MSNAQHFDIGVIVPLEEELEAFFNIFPSKANYTENEILIHEVESGKSELKMLVILQSDMGHTEAAEAAKYILEKYNFGLIVSIGIAGGLSTDLQLGDVCYTGKVINVYENSKAFDKNDETKSLEISFSPNYFETATPITRSLNFARTQPELSSSYNTWMKNQEEFILAENLPDRIGRDGRQEIIKAPKSMNGSIACGLVTRSKNYNNKLHDLDRRILAIDTESGAVFRQSNAYNTEALTIRGISDYADTKKGILEEITNGKIRKIAAHNAVTFLRMQLENRYFTKKIVEHRQSSAHETQLNLLSRERSPITDPLDELSSIIDEQLREYSPEYRLHPKGYRVPAPRVQRNIGSQSNVGRNYFPPTELRDTLHVDRRFLISVPRNFPDRSLPWIFAHELLDAEFEGKQVVPIVVDGSRLSPPRNGISRISPIDLNLLQNREGVHFVFLIEGVSFESTTKLRFLKQEIGIWDNCHFVLLSTHSPNILRENEFVLESSLAIYGLCDISFMEISNFIQRSFEMSGTQSEVVAKRLWDTFKSFDLSAHPTYFAGIPRETLMALLHANKRAELIQLAVDGFLTFVVADDKAKVPLSRTTRARFLSDLVVKLKVEVQQIGVSELLKTVEEFAIEMDFDIDPMEFLASFRDKGILRLDGEQISFTLPFIERYLLAKRLSEDRELSIKYFDFPLKTFDPQVFDLYVEIGMHEVVKAQVFQGVKLSLKQLAQEEGEQHILLTNDVLPKFVSSIDRIKALQKRVAEALIDVQTGKSDKDKKQKLLDLTDRVREFQAKQSKDYEVDLDDEFAVALDDALKNFLLGVLLLGSGAENLSGSEKREMSKKLVELGSLICHVWTKKIYSIDFQKIREIVLNDDFLLELNEDNENGYSIRDLRLMVSSLLDDIEGAALAGPLRTVLGLLCEEARTPVLALSLKSELPDSVVARLLHAAWLTDINVAEGKNLLAEINRSLPAVQFLRICMAMHCQSRAFWSHWKLNDREEILNAAEGFLKPISAKFDKGHILRQVGED